jgi:hypothetical protein
VPLDPSIAGAGNVTPSRRSAFQTGHTLGGGYQLRSPQRSDATPTLPGDPFPPPPPRCPRAAAAAHQRSLDIDKESYLAAQREIAEGTIGIEGIDGKLYRADQVRRKRPKSKSAERPEVPS